MRYDVFISYRREGGDTLAQLIYDRLVHRGYKVFLDIESMRSGKFNEKLLEVIGECSDFVLILPPDALKRCENPDDWVLMEVSHAIKCQKNIIPVMMRGFSWPESLPAGLEELPHYNGIHDSKDYFDAVMDKLTSLLASKPSVVKWGSFGNVDAKLARKYNFKEKIARRKKLVLAMSVMVLMAVGIGALGYSQYQKEQEALANMVSIVLSAPEGMSAAEYYDAIEILEQRFDILAGEEKYYFEVENEKVNVDIPLDVFGGVEVETFLECYVTRPTKLYLCTPESGEFVAVERNAIESISLEKGLVPNLDAEKYSFEGEYYYSRITFAKKAQEKIEDLFGQDVEVLHLMQDREQYPTKYYWYELFAGEAENEYYLVDIYQQENVNQLVKYNYENDFFTVGFDYDIIYPVVWEKAEESAIKGKYQCDVKDLTGEQVIVQYALSTYGEITDGEFQDAVKAFKVRLDALATPYALGYTKGGEKQISIKIASEYFGQDIMHILGDMSVNLDISNPLRGLYIYGETASCVTDDGENYRLEFQVGESKAEELKSSISEISSSKNPEIYLTFDGGYREGVLTKGNVEDVLRDIENGKIVFDNLIGWGREVIDEDSKYLVDFIVACINEIDMPECYYVKRYRLEGEDEAELGVSSVYIAERVEFIKQTLKEICPTANVECDGTALNIELNLEVNEELPGKAVDLIQEIYEKCDLQKGEYRVRVECVGEKRESLVFIFANSVLANRMEYYGTYMGAKMEGYYEEFQRLVNEDIFFQQEMVPMGENWLEDWNFILN